MPYLAVDKDGTGVIYNYLPIRSEEGYWMFPFYYFEGEHVKLPPGSIKALIGRELTWNDEPVELNEETLKK